MKDYRTIDPEDLSEDQLQELVDELLKSCPIENLIGYLPEEL